MLSGIARKISLVLVFISACGWIVFVTGFSIRNAEQDSVAQSMYTSHWLVSVGGLIVYFLYFLHLFWGNRITSIITLCVLPLYLGVVGAVLQFNSRDTQCDTNFASILHDNNFELHILLEFIGALLSGVFMWMSIILWPLLKYTTRNNDDYVPINN